MAKVKIQGHASGTGVLTVTAPNTSTDRTITLPDATGTLLNSDGSGASLTALNASNLGSGTVPTARLGSGTANSSVHLRGDGTWAAAGGGKVLQVVGAKINSSATNNTTSTSFVASTITGTITPSATSSKILIIVSTAGSSEGSGRMLFWTLCRGSTNLGHSTGGFGHLFNDNDRVRASIHMNYLDSPSTTSATTYTVYFRSNNGGSVEMPADQQTEHMTLIEIGA